MGFWVFLVHPTVVTVLLSASVERCFVSCMQDFFFVFYASHMLQLFLISNFLLKKCIDLNILNATKYDCRQGGEWG